MTFNPSFGESTPNMLVGSSSFVDCNPTLVGALRPLLGHRVPCTALSRGVLSFVPRGFARLSLFGGSTVIIVAPLMWMSSRSFLLVHPWPRTFMKHC